MLYRVLTEIFSPEAEMHALVVMMYDMPLKNNFIYVINLDSIMQRCNLYCLESYEQRILFS